MTTELEKTLIATDTEAQYDECAKRILGHKSILARILEKTVDEFHGMSPKEIENYIEGEPIIGKVPVDSGVTNQLENKNDTYIVGLNTESAEIYEGFVRFDIIFYVRMKDGIIFIL